MKRRNFLKSSAALATVSMANSGIFAGAQQTSNNSEDNMILLTNGTGWAGIDKTASELEKGTYGIDAMIAGIRMVEAEPKIRSVGYGGWPNILGVMEFDGGVMDGSTRRVGSVGALKHTYHAADVAKAVMTELNHVMVTGDGADRLAAEIGLPKVNTLLENSKEVWLQKIKDIL